MAVRSQTLRFMNLELTYAIGKLNGNAILLERKLTIMLVINE